MVDIGRAFDVFKQVLAPLNYRNLDDMPEFKSVNTTTEFLTRHVFDGLAAAVKKGELGRDGREIARIRVTVAESPTARAWYEGACGSGRPSRFREVSTSRPAAMSTTGT